METIRNAVLRCLDDCSFDDDKLITKLNCIIEKVGDEACQIVFSVSTHINLVPDQAADH